MSDILTETELAALLRELERRVDEELARRQAEKPIRPDEVEMEREDIAQGVATDDEKAQLRATLEQLRRELVELEARIEGEDPPFADDVEKRERLGGLIERIESALDRYDP